MGGPPPSAFSNPYLDRGFVKCLWLLGEARYSPGEIVLGISMAIFSLASVPHRLHL